MHPNISDFPTQFIPMICQCANYQAECWLFCCLWREACQLGKATQWLFSCDLTTLREISPDFAKFREISPNFTNLHDDDTGGPFRWWRYFHPGITSSFCAGIPSSSAVWRGFCHTLFDKAQIHTTLWHQYFFCKNQTSKPHPFLHEWSWLKSFSLRRSYILALCIELFFFFPALMKKMGYWLDSLEVFCSGFVIAFIWP